eukprot:SAG11_NODE_1871_length_4150_cov_26.309800_2_plen_68_part_00
MQISGILVVVYNHLKVHGAKSFQKPWSALCRVTSAVTVATKQIMAILTTDMLIQFGVALMLVGLQCV